MDHTSPFRMEAAGSLTPELEGGPRSGPHHQRSNTKGRERTHEARQAAKAPAAPAPRRAGKGHE